MYQTQQDNNFSNAQLHLCRKKTQKEISKYEYAVIFLMILIVISSIVWSISIYVMPIEVHNAFMGASVKFRPRDFAHMSIKEKENFHRDLDILFNRTYPEQNVNTQNFDIQPEKHILTQEEMSVIANNTTKTPKVRKIPHVFQTIEDVRHAQDTAEMLETEMDDNATNIPIIKFNITQDRQFLTNMTFVIASANWHSSYTMSLIEGVPFLSEVMAIVWTAMFLIFQSSIKRYSVVPKPWRIVLPSIVMCTLMTSICLIYALMSNHYLSRFCQQLRNNLTDPNAISCGEALVVLRPVISYNKYKPDICLKLFRVSMFITFSLWCLTLLIMLLRYFFAIDFRLMDVYVQSADSQNMKIFKLPEYTEVPLEASMPKIVNLQVADQNRCSLDDFQSAKSHLSEVAIPLL